MGTWILQALFQALLVAAAAVLAVFSPWRPLQFASAVFLVAFIIVATRNPALAYRRAFRFIVLGAAGAFTLGTSGRVAGSTDIPQRLGDLSFFVEWGTGPLWWVMLVLAALCLIGDIALSVAAARPGANVAQTHQLEASIRTVGDGVQIECTATLVGGAGGMVVTKPQFAIGGFRFTGTLSRYQGAMETPCVQLTIDEGAAQRLHVSASIKGRAANWLRFRARWSLFGLLPLQGELVCETAVGRTPIKVPLRFSPPGR